MTSKGFFSFDFTRSSLSKSFSRSTVALHFWHCFILIDYSFLVIFLVFILLGTNIMFIFRPSILIGLSIFLTLRRPPKPSHRYTKHLSFFFLELIMWKGGEGGRGKKSEGGRRLKNREGGKRE